MMDARAEIISNSQVGLASAADSGRSGRRRVRLAAAEAARPARPGDTPAQAIVCLMVRARANVLQS